MTAAEKILKKALVGSNLNSAQWNCVQAQIRDMAFFSSTVESQNILKAAQSMVAEQAAGGMSPSEIRRDMRKVLNEEGYQPNERDRGTIKDLFSKSRLDVIINHNVSTARGFVNWANGNTPGAFAAFPCQEFKRTHRRKVERTTWRQRWTNAGGQFFEGRMIAPKDSPVWARLSAFGNPFPPFDWGSGMGVVDVSRREALRLGVINDNEIKDHVQQLTKQQDDGTLPSMTGNLQANVDPDVVPLLRQQFGDLARFTDGKAIFTSPTFETPCRLPSATGLVDVDPSAVASLAPEYRVLVPSLLRSSALMLETLSGQKLKATLENSKLVKVELQ